MASISYLFYSCALLLLSSWSLLLVHSSHVGGEKESLPVVSVGSLSPPAAFCSSPKVLPPATLKVVHRHGPCSPFNNQTVPSHEQILNEDQARVDYLHHRISTASYQSQAGGSSAAPISAHTGSFFGIGNYVVTVGFGTPKTDLSLIFDTGSDLTWIQCKPCGSQCYHQQQPLYDPSQSSTYHSISCTSPVCSQLLGSSTCSASSSACRYTVWYADKSHSVGSIVQDTLTLTPSDPLPSFGFGCGDQSSGLFGQAAGVLGLGLRPESLISQASQKYGKIFSYCLPSTSKSTGYLKLGSSGTPANVKFTPMLTDSTMPSYYFVKLIGIAVGGQRLSFPPTVLSNPGTLLDSGTVITRLPPSVYSALRSKFQSLISKYNYPRAPIFQILDTCYDLSAYKTVKVAVPAITFLFDGGATLDVDFSGILYVANLSQACLAFAANDDAGDVATIGNVQQRRFTVVYDVAGKRIGFGPGGCS